MFWSSLSTTNDHRRHWDWDFNKSTVIGAFFLSTATLGFTACKPDSTQSCSEHRITIIATNDIHGALEPNRPELGGMAFLSQAIKNIKKSIQEEWGECGGALALDGGDQFQGTLLSNFSEGETQILAMNEAGYDAVVPGNHDYDFGPIGWLVDIVGPESEDKDPRGAFRRLSKISKFPFLGANVYTRESIVDWSGEPLEVSPIRCIPTRNAIPDWSKARRLDFLKPYQIFNVAKKRVAVIGIEHAHTPVLTVPANVQDLCFRDEVETYLEIYNDIKDQADLFVMVIHQGNSNNSKSITEITKKIISVDPNALHAVIAGHTHFVHEDWHESVPMIQSGHSAERFGRIDFIIRNNQMETIAKAGIRMFHTRCDDNATDFCENREKVPFYHGKPTQPDPKVVNLIAQAKTKIAPIANRELGFFTSTLSRDRINDSPLGQFLTDQVREATGADVAIVNSGGIRTSLKAGRFTYSDLFQILPFNNKLVTVKNVPLETLITVFSKTVQTCGQSGILHQSGLKIKFRRNCFQNTTGIDPEAKLVEIRGLDDTLYYLNGVIIKNRTFSVSTLDFLLAGGSGTSSFEGLIPETDHGILREVIADHLSKNPKTHSVQMDERFVRVR